MRTELAMIARELGVPMPAGFPTTVKTDRVKRIQHLQHGIPQKLFVQKQKRTKQAKNSRQRNRGK